MGWNDLTMRLRTLFSRRRSESELDEELSFHLAMEAEKNRARGVDVARGATGWRGGSSAEWSTSAKSAAMRAG